MSDRVRCDATIEFGPKRPSGVVYGRRYCRNRPIKGYEHCHHHLTWDERKRKREGSA